MAAPFAIYLYGPDAGPLPRRFEEAARRLESLERLHFEWDGSFVWRGTMPGGAGEESEGMASDAGGGPSGEAVWQVDGMLYDLGERIQYVDLKGHCPREAWRTLLEIFAGGDDPPLTILRLPHRREQDRARFEEEIWGKPTPPSPLA